MLYPDTYNNPFADIEKIAQGSFGVLEEIDFHERVFGKEPWKMGYDYGYCRLCNSRIDGFGYCACDGGAR